MDVLFLHDRIFSSFVCCVCKALHLPFFHILSK
jgi:hypothetical protein